MPYKLVDGQLVAETERNYLNLSSSKRELFDALKAQVTRAEAAETCAASLEKERDALRAQLEGAQRDIEKLSEVISGLSDKLIKVYI